MDFKNKSSNKQELNKLQNCEYNELLDMNNMNKSLIEIKQQIIDELEVELSLYMSLIQKLLAVKEKESNENTSRINNLENELKK